MEKVIKATSKKVVTTDQPPKKVPKFVVKESFSPAKEVMPSKSGILKRLKKMDHRPRNSPERSSSFSPKAVSQITRKPQINRKCMVFREIPTPVSPVPKKRRVEDVAKKIYRKKKESY